MFTKLYEKMKKNIIENYKFFLGLILLLILTTVELPYYVDCPGGIIDVTSKMEIKEGYPSKGTFNLSYVSELKGTLPILLVARFKTDWDVVKKEEVVLENETLEENNYRNHLLLEEANHNAILVAYEKAKREVQVTNQKLFVTYVDINGKTNLKIKDEILEVNGVPVNSKTNLQKVIKDNVIGDIIPIKIKRDNEILMKTAEIYELDGRSVLGIMLTEQMELETEPPIEFHFEESESGPSGGLMMSLAIYNALVKEDITHGKTIVGTGTIERDGTVGEIGGVEYKLKGAVKEKADIFLVPAGKNYEDAKALKEEKGYSIALVPIETFDEALYYLQSLK